VFGDRNSARGEVEVLAIASNVFLNEGAKVFRLEANAAVAVADSGLTWGVHGIWFSSGKRYYVVGPGIHQKRSLGEPVWKVYLPGEVTSYFSAAIRGSAVNDVFVVGSFREVVHFNGVRWHRYIDLNPGSSGSFGAVAVKGNVMIAVGGVSPRALVVTGRRN